MSHNERLTHYIKYSKISSREFSKVANIEYNRFNKYINGGTKNPGVDVVIAVLTAFPDLSARWWLCDEGEMIRGEVIPEGMVLVDAKEQSELNEEILTAIKDMNDLQHKLIVLQEKVIGMKDREQELKEEILRLKKK